MPVLCVVFFALSLLGLLASVALHVASFLPGRIPREALGIFPVAFVVWIPAVVTAQRRLRGRGARAGHAALVEGAPAWWRNSMLSFAGIGILSVLITALITWGGWLKADWPPGMADIKTPSAALFFLASITMVFYALSALALHPARVLEKDPAAEWPETDTRELVLQYTDGSLNGVRLGQPAYHLRAFGRPDNRWPSWRAKYIFRRLGLIVETEKDRIDYLAFVMEDLERLGLEPCRVTLALAGGARRELGPGTIQSDIVALLGAPDERDEDAEERIHTYRSMGLRFELEYALDGRLRRLNAFRG